MGLNIKNAETHRLAVQLAQLTGETLTRTVTIALKERRCASRPLLDDRSPEAILGYDEHGLPR